MSYEEARAASIVAHVERGLREVDPASRARVLALFQAAIPRVAAQYVAAA